MRPSSSPSQVPPRPTPHVQASVNAATGVSTRPLRQRQSQTGTALVFRHRARAMSTNRKHLHQHQTGGACTEPARVCTKVGAAFELNYTEEPTRAQLGFNFTFDLYKVIGFLVYETVARPTVTLLAPWNAFLEAPHRTFKRKFPAWLQVLLTVGLLIVYILLFFLIYS